jgi:thiol-disulfide isomerase/thioredoxin
MNTTDNIRALAVNHDRRSFLRAGAISIAAASVGMIGSVMQQATAAGVQLPVEGEFPSLGGATGWLNSQPLTAAGLRGKVVLIDFCTYTCITWLRQLPYVRAWSEKYRDRGLVVIGVHTPEFPFEKDIENVRRALNGIRVDFPIAIDNDYATWRALNNNYWPALYFIDTKGVFGIIIRRGRIRTVGNDHSTIVGATPEKPPVVSWFPSRGVVLKLAPIGAA